MRRAALGAAVFSAACGGAAPAPVAQTPPPDAKRVDESKAGIVSGRVTFEGAVPESVPAKLDSDPACAREHPNGLKLDTILVTNGGLDNVFVYVKDGLGNYYFDAPTEAVTLDQKGCNYSPHVLGVRDRAAARDRQQRRDAAQRATPWRRSTRASTWGRPSRA